MKRPTKTRARENGGLGVRRRGARKRAVGTRVPMTIPQGANQRSSIDFLSDAIADGHRFRIFRVQTRKGVRSGPGVSPVHHPVAKYRRPVNFGTIRIVLPQPIWESCQLASGWCWWGSVRQAQRVDQFRVRRELIEALRLVSRLASTIWRNRHAGLWAGR